MANLKKNITYNFIYQFLILFLPFITAPYLSRVIGASGIGIYSYSYSIALYFTYITILGLNNYGNRSIASVQSNIVERSKTFFEIYILQVGCFSITAVLYTLYIIYFASDNVAAIIQGVIVLSSLIDINWFFFGMEQFKLTVIRNTIVKVVTVICVFAFVKTSSDIYKYISIMAFGTLASQCCLWPFLKKYVIFTKIHLKDVKKHIKPNLVLFVPVIAVSVYCMLDKIMVGHISGMTELGYYDNAEKIVSVPMALITAVGTVMLPRMTALVSSNRKKESKKYIHRTMVLVLAFVNMAIWGLFSISKEFSILFYGADFARTGVIINYYAITLIFFAFGNVVRTQYLIPNKKDGIFLTSAILGAIVNFILNLLLIPKYSSVGASISTIAAEFAVCFYQCYCVRRDIYFGQYFKYEGVFLIIGIIMYLCIKVVPPLINDWITLLIRIAVGGVIYTFLSGLYLVKIQRASIVND